MGKAEENKRKKRLALLQHAYSLFTNKGIGPTTISDIAGHAGVGKGTFYSYFKDKDDLIEKLIAEKAEDVIKHAIHDLEKHPEAVSVEDKFVVLADDILEQLSADEKLPRFINKNLNYGIFKKALTRDDVVESLDIRSLYYNFINDGSTWRDPDIMLYTIVELVGSTCHSIILQKDPVDLETYKPYLFECVRKIISVFRVEGPEAETNDHKQ